MTVKPPRSVTTGVSAMPLHSPVANASRRISPRRHPGDRGRFGAVLKTYRNRTGNGQKDCVTGDLMRRVELFRLVARALAKDS